MVRLTSILILDIINTKIYLKSIDSRLSRKGSTQIMWQFGKFYVYCSYFLCYNLLMSPNLLNKKIMKTHARWQIEETFVRLFMLFLFTHYWEFFLLNNRNFTAFNFHIIFLYRELHKLLEILRKVDSKMLLSSPTWHLSTYAFWCIYFYT